MELGFHLPYGACPGEVCITGNPNNGGPWSICTSGTCNGNMDCNVTPDDVCGNPPGDGGGTDYCLPQGCDMQTPCPDGIQCYPGFNNNPSLCLWFT